MVDIDEICVSVCREHMKAHHAGAFDDPRFELVIDDAKNQMELAPDHSFDVIICDLADPIPDGPCYLLYTKEWFELCKRKLTLGGVFLTQSGPSGLGTFKSVFSPVHHTLQPVVSFSLSLSLPTSHLLTHCKRSGFHIRSCLQFARTLVHRPVRL